MMTATILLVRHAAHEHLGKVLSGRSDDVPLSAAGREQAQRLAQRLGKERLDAVHTSPVRRARDTAQTIAAVANVPEDVAAPLDEVDFGTWSGKSFAELGKDPLWHAWNERRSYTVPPGGEAMVAVQERALSHLRVVAREASGRVVAMVSHADVIRAGVAGILGLSLDRVLSFDVDPASVTRIVAGRWGERVMSLNERWL